jgi:hypothetical protein
MSLPALKTPPPETAPGLFDYARWGGQVARLAAAYRAARPFPHIVIDAFLDEDVVRRVVAEFPGPTDTEWIQYKHYNEHKLGKSKREEFPPFIGALVDEFNSPAFAAWLSVLTGIPGLMPDPMLEGGGMHQTETGGFLNVHADFTMHHYQTRWRRRCNLILYLNEGWQPEWGGDLELWSRDMGQAEARVAPVMNRAVVFSTDDTSFHGYPDPISCPPDVTRRSLALYYFTEETDPAYAPKSTTYRARPSDGARAFFIWADTKALALYSKLKSKLGFSDEAISRVLKRLSRRS